MKQTGVTVGPLPGLLSKMPVVCIGENAGLLLQGVGRAENVLDFVSDGLADLITGNTEVAAGIEYIGAVEHDTAYACGHGETYIRVDVYLADCRSGSLAELLFRYAHSVRELAAGGVDLLNILLRNRRSTVENDGKAGKHLFNLIEYVET